MHARQLSHRRSTRDGQMMVIVAVAMPVVVLLAVLVIQTWLMMVAQQRLGQLSDAAARLAALMVAAEETATADEDLVATVEAFIAEHHQLASPPEVTLNRPPSEGPYAGNPAYVEVIITAELAPPLLGGGPGQQVTARAVAGNKPISSGARLVTLDSSAATGVTLSGSGSLTVRGGIIVNSTAGGLDENGEPVGNGSSGFSIRTNGQATITADDVQTAGGVNDPSDFFSWDPGARHPLRAAATPIADPLADLPVPSLELGADPTMRGSARISRGNAQLSAGNRVRADGSVLLLPGVYDWIEITGGTVEFAPGIYILRGGKQSVLRITGGEVFADGGVLFYNTSDGFEVSSSTQESGPRAWNYGGIFLTSEVDLQPFSQAGHPLDGLLIYQDRQNTRPIELRGQANLSSANGTIYAPAAEVQITGGGTLGCQLVVSRLSKAGNGSLVIDCTRRPPTTAHQVVVAE